jgi:hypothetical protein
MEIGWASSHLALAAVLERWAQGQGRLAGLFQHGYRQNQDVILGLADEIPDGAVIGMRQPFQNLDVIAEEIRREEFNAIGI